MQFKAKDGELRLYDYHSSTTGLYMPVYFTNADMTFPIGRAKVEETMAMDRGNVDASASYYEGSDASIIDPLPVSFTSNLDDQTDTAYLRTWLSGATTLNGRTLVTQKSQTTVLVGSNAVITTPSFADSSKMAYRVEVKWDGSNNYGWSINEVYFPPDQQTITENEDSVVLSMNGLIYGTVSPTTSFYGGVNCNVAS